MAALGLAAALGAGGRRLAWGCPWASSLPLFSAWQNGQGHRLQRRRLCLSVRKAWFPVGLWLCSIVRLVAPGRVSGTPRSRWWAGLGFLSWCMQSASQLLRVPSVPQAGALCSSQALCRRLGGNQALGGGRAIQWSEQGSCGASGRELALTNA